MTQQMQKDDELTLERPPVFTPDTQGVLSPREEVLAAYTAAGLRLAEAARAAGLRYRDANQASQRPSFRMAVHALIEAGKGFARAGAVATIAGRIQHKANRHDELNRLVAERAMAADPRYLNPDPVYLSSLRRDDGTAYDVNELLLTFPNLGELYDETNPACAMVDPDSFLVPGATTGFLAASVKTVGKGEQARTVTEYRVDEALIRQLSSHEEGIAKAAGQDKKGHGGPVKQYVNIDMGRLVGATPAAEPKLVEEAK